MKTLKAIIFLGVIVWVSTAYATKHIAGSLYSYLGNTQSEVPIRSQCLDGNSIQIALLLDTSGSMSGLIEQAKSQLWNILGEIARTKKSGKINF